MKYTIEQLTKTLKGLKFQIFNDGKLNIVGVREDFTLTNNFEDKLYVWSSTIPLQEFTITTTPGKFWWEQFTRKEGVAILTENQYINSHQLGFHRGKYEALVQVRPVTVYRDDNKNTTLDMKKTETGLFGINIHRASSKFISLFIGEFSAGCQVFSSPKEYNSFIALCKSTKQINFSYTLLNNKLITKFNP